MKKTGIIALFVLFSSSLGLTILSSCNKKDTDVCKEHGHLFNDPTYSWNSDFSSCTAKRVCQRNAKHIEEETVATYYDIKTNESDDQSYSKIYFADFANEAFEDQQYEEIVEVEIVDDLMFVLNEDAKSYGVKSVVLNRDKGFIVPSNFNNLPVTDVMFNGFSNEHVRSISLPDTIERIAKRAFATSKITSFTFPNKVSVIEEYLFSGCENLSTIVLGESIQKLPQTEVGFCSTSTNLSSIEVNENNPYFASYGKALYNKNLDTLVVFPLKQNDIKFPANLKHIDDYAFNNYGGLSITGSPLIVPEGVISLGEGAFCGANFSSLTLPNSLKTIGKKAFYYCCEMVSINIPDGISTIPDHAFYNDNSLLEIVFPDSVTSIGDSAFSKCAKLVSINLPIEAKEIGNNAFSECQNLVDVKLNNKLEKIGSYAFSQCSNLKTINLPKGLKELNYCFSNCPLLEGNTYNSCVYLGNNDEPYLYLLSALNKDEISQYQIHAQCELVYSKAFSNCSLIENFVLPEGIKYVCNEAFSQCELLKSVSIPSSLKAIAIGAFDASLNIEKIIVDPNNAYYCANEDALLSKDKSVFIYCPSAKKGEINIPKEVITFSDTREYSPFAHCKFLTAINVDSHCASFASYDGALYSKDLATLLLCPLGKEGELRLADKCVSIDRNVFSEKNKIETITLSDKLSLPLPSFGLCSYLKRFEASERSENFATVDGVLYSKNKDTLYRVPLKYEQKSFTIPSFVKYVSNSSFLNSEIDEVNLPLSIVEISASFINEYDNRPIINYLGTMAEWNNVNIVHDSFYGTSFVVHCSDGNITVRSMGAI